MNKKKAVYITLMLISILAVAFNINLRYKTESSNKSVEFIMDYKELVLMANQSEHDLDWWLNEIHRIGFKKVAIEQESINSMIDGGRPIKKILMSSLNRNYDDYESLPESIKIDIQNKNIDKFDVIVETKSNPDKEFILNGLNRMYSAGAFKVYIENDTTYIVLNGNETDSLYLNVNPLFDDKGATTDRFPENTDSKVSFMGIGYDVAKIEQIKRAGLEVLARPLNKSDDSSRLVDAFIEDTTRLGIPQDYVLFAGSSVLGYDGENMESLNPMIREIKDKKMGIGLIETFTDGSYIKQDGIEIVTSRQSFDVIRVLPISKYMQRKYGTLGYEGAEEIENTIFRGIVERGVRGIYFRPFLESESKYVTNAEEYELMMTRLQERLNSHNITIGDAGRYTPFDVNSIVIGLIGIGVVVVGVLILKLLFGLPEVFELGLLIIGSLGSLGMAVVMPYYFKILFSFTSAVVFPVLSILIMTEFIKQKFVNRSVFRLRSTFKDSTLILFTCVAISLLGGLFIGSILTDMKFITKMDSFRGVKIGQLLAIGSFLVIYLIKFGYHKELKTGENTLGDVMKDVFAILEESIKIKHIILGTVVLFAGFVYISRTGNESTIKPSELEMMFRNFLEYTLIARPRTKEFLMAFPALVCLVYFADRFMKWAVLPLGLVAAIGLASIPNTFSHIGAPLYMSFSRSVIGAGFGLVIGYIAILIIHLGLKFIQTTISRRNSHE